MSNSTRILRLTAHLAALAMLGATSAATASALLKSYSVWNSFDRVTEDCDNGRDDDNDGKVDGDDSDCQDLLGGWGGGLQGSLPGDTDLHPIPPYLVSYGGIALTSEIDQAYGSTSAYRRGRVQVFRTLFDVLGNSSGMTEPYLEVYGTSDGDRVGASYSPTEYGHAIGTPGLDMVGMFDGSRSGYLTESDYDFKLYGSSGSDFGANTVVADFDNDGHQDIAVAAPKYDLGGTDTGQVSIFWGPLTGSQSVWSNTTRIYGEEAGEGFGGGSMSAGDANGDGFIDLIIGSPYRDAAGKVNNGRTYVFSGRDLHAWQGSYGYADNWAEITLDGETTSSYSGWDVAAGPVSSIGGPSVVVGAPYYSSRRGRVYTVQAYKMGSGDLGALTRYVYTGDSTYDYMGWQVGIGDHDVDGEGDVMFSAPYDDVNGTNSGAIFLLTDARTLEHTDQAMYWGDRSYGRLGYTMNVGEADWDGYPDLLAVSSGGSTPHSATYQSSIGWR